VGLGPELSNSSSGDHDVGHRLQVIGFGVCVPSSCATTSVCWGVLTLVESACVWCYFELSLRGCDGCLNRSISSN
jgi:hypothetical protein